MIKELIKDLAKYLPSMIVPAIVGVIALPVITRLFPPSDYGDYTLVITTVNVLSIFSVAWLSSSLARFLPIYEKMKDTGSFFSTVLQSTISSIIIFCLLFWGILLIAKNYIKPDLYFLMRIGILLFICNSFFRIFTQLLRARRFAIWYSIFTIWHSILWVAIGILLVIVFGFGIDGLLWGTLLSTALALPFLWKISMGMPPLRQGKLFSQRTWEMAKYGIPTIGINLSTWALSLSDRYILQFFRGSYEVGIYSASYNIAEQAVLLIIYLFLLPSAPIAYRIWEKEGIGPSREFINKLTRYYLLIGLPATAGLGVLAKPIARVMFPAGYFLGYRIILLVSSGTLLVGVSHRFALGLDFYKRTDLNMICFLGSMLLNIGLNFIFIPKYGYVAAAATTFASYAFLLLMTIVISRYFFVWDFPFRSLIKAGCASALMAAVVYPVGNHLSSSVILNLVLAILTGVVIYPIILILLHEIKLSEIDALLKLMRS